MRNGAGLASEGGNAPAPHRPAVPGSPRVPQNEKDDDPVALPACTASHDPAGPSLRSATVSTRTSMRPDTGRSIAGGATTAANKGKMIPFIVSPSCDPPERT